MSQTDSKETTDVETSAIELASHLDSLLRSYVTTNESEGTQPRKSDGSSIPAAKQGIVAASYDACPVALASLQLDLRAAKILIADADEARSASLESYLRQDRYQNLTTAATLGRVARVLQTEAPDLILVGVGCDPESALDILRAKSLDESIVSIPTIALVSRDDTTAKRRCLEAGATDLLLTPVDPVEFLPRVRNALTMRAQSHRIATETSRFESMLQRRTAEVERTREQLILSLARAAEHRDNDTGNHVIRVGHYVAIIARAMGWPADRVEMLAQAAQLHDVGKIGVPDAILFKEGKLDPDEYELIKNHCSWGRSIIEPYNRHEFQQVKAHARIGETILHVRSSPMLMLAARIAQTHHENWDGTGYPLGLAGEDIPLEGRITAVADVYDALASKRPYKEAFPREKCFKILESERGKKFDPRVLDAFFSQQDEIVEVQLQLMD